MAGQKQLRSGGRTFHGEDAEKQRRDELERRVDDLAAGGKERFKYHYGASVTANYTYWNSPIGFLGKGLAKMDGNFISC